MQTVLGLPAPWLGGEGTSGPEATVTSLMTKAPPITPSRAAPLLLGQAHGSDGLRGRNIPGRKSSIFQRARAGDQAEAACVDPGTSSPCPPICNQAGLVLEKGRCPGTLQGPPGLTSVHTGPRCGTVRQRRGAVRAPRSGASSSAPHQEPPGRHGPRTQTLSASYAFALLHLPRGVCARETA